jgi:hypoxanthine phosphoribosyltransferase
MISSGEIKEVVQQLAQHIADDCCCPQPNGSTTTIRPLMICLLKGACQFYCHLLDEMKLLKMGYDTEFVRASSYQGMSTTGSVKMMGELNIDALQGRKVYLVEDIVDTGTTLSTLLPMIQDLGKPTSAEVVSLLDKRLDDSTQKKFQAKFVGFSIPNHFIVGYGYVYFSTNFPPVFDMFGNEKLSPYKI